MRANVSGLLPSKITGDYWVYADGPAATAADGARTGKWLVFVPARQVDQWWELIRLATEQGLLGISAKAATARPNELATSQRTKLICVYTRDWQDHADVLRVLQQLRDLGVISRLSYKTDRRPRPASTAPARRCTSASQAARTSIASGAEPSGYVFTGADGGPLSPDYLTRTFRDLVTASDLPPV